MFSRRLNENRVGESSSMIILRNTIEIYSGIYIEFREHVSLSQTSCQVSSLGFRKKTASCEAEGQSAS